jgi:hypothetical protein
MLVAQIFKDNLWGKKRQMKTKRPKVRANAGKESSIDKLAGKKKKDNFFSKCLSDKSQAKEKLSAELRKRNKKK